MDSIPIVLNLLFVLFLVVLNGFFVAAEFALVKVRQTRLTQMVNEGNKRAAFAQKVTQKLDAYLSACQVGITLASLGLGWVGEPVIAEMIVKPLLGSFHLPDYLLSTISFGIAFTIITFLHIVLGELAPKSLAIQKAETTSLWVAAPLMFFYKLLYPAIYVLNGSANRMLKWFGLEPVSEHEAAHTEEEIRLLVNQSHQSGHIDQTELSLVEHVFDFSETVAREIMIPRIDMICLYTTNSFEENLAIVSSQRHTRFPVATGDKDNLIGFVHATDFYLSALDKQNTKLEEILRPLLTVPESMEISHVLRLMQKKRSQIAIVIDEYGGTAGLLTMEDILEEIVGDIQDEFDTHERPELEKLENGLSVAGKMLLTELNDHLPFELVSDEVDTVGGWLYSQLEEEIAVGASVEIEDHLFTIAAMDNHRVTRITIKKLNRQPAEPAEAQLSAV
ncbi:HlyC/CorC family transporter [Brevibacillus composti]|uniref:HlyC/CorC family transporter n=1 Tax=Brevibacillus composti TaxID=2796470 RepID=A0A7T5JN74_9BACL|nr:hemolysin family protein [Brevibacillus composti]QQE73889.1 HlyC/CorC family transporter [Brevibacillus composti]QUO40974.1 HlyC/CorC family transporter [Brevibacillus composti]